MSSPLDSQNPRGGLARGMRTFGAQAAAVRAESWPVTLTLADTTSVDIAKSASRLSRIPAPQGSGYIQQVHAVFLFPVSGDFIPTLGAEWTVTASEIASEISESWRCFEVIPSAAGTEHRAMCFRLD